MMPNPNPIRPLTQNPNFNPFSSQPGWVVRSDLVEVEREFVSTPAPTSTFHKRYKEHGGIDLRPFTKYERGILVRLDEDRVGSVAKLHTLEGDTEGRVTRVISYDAGPSLASWLQVDFTGPNGERLPHPLGSPKALVQILGNTLLALKHLHEKNYVHCDIHLGNVCMAVDLVDARKVVVPAPEKIRLIDFGYSFKRNDSYQPPDALPIWPTPSRHSPRFRAALEADYQRGDRHATEVLRLDGRIDLHALGLMARELDVALKANWSSIASTEQHEAETLIQNLIAELMALDADPLIPIPADLHQMLAKPLVDWLEREGRWRPFPFTARGLKSDQPAAAASQEAQQKEAVHRPAASSSKPAETPPRSPASVPREPRFSEAQPARASVEEPIKATAPSQTARVLSVLKVRHFWQVLGAAIAVGVAMALVWRLFGSEPPVDGDGGTPPTVESAPIPAGDILEYCKVMADDPRCLKK